MANEQTSGTTTTITGNTNNFDEPRFTNIREILDMSYDDMSLTYDLQYVSSRGTDETLCLTENQIKEIWLHYQKERASNKLFQHIMSKR
jgi:hypothetical protein